MATATILQIYCVKESTGTDFDHLKPALSAGFAGLSPVLFGGFPPQNAVNLVFGLATAIDEARSDPDNLYVTSFTGGGVDNAIWPGGGSTIDIQQGQSVSPGVTIPVGFSHNISLWDHDFPSADDLLASVTVFGGEAGLGPISKKGFSNVEFSAYYVTYRVD